MQVQKVRVLNKIMVIILTLVMLAGTLPTASFSYAEGQSQVRLIVENTIWADEEGAPWSGTLIDTYVDIDDSSTILSILKEGLKKENRSEKGIQDNEVTEISTLANGAAGDDCKWEGSVDNNDIHTQFSDYTVAKNTIIPGAVIKLKYTGTVTKKAKQETTAGDMSTGRQGSSSSDEEDSDQDPDPDRPTVDRTLGAATWSMTGTFMSLRSALDDTHENQVRVIVENTVFTPETAEELGADWSDDFWSGTLVDTWVDIDESSTMMSSVVAALNTIRATQTGAENNYLSEINGLSEFDGGWMSGWMGTLNDWFTNEGFGGFTVANGKLEAGDEIRIMYTASYGDDLGGSWGNNETTLKSLIFSAGTLDKAFDKDTYEYTLNVPKGTEGIIVTPTATNKNFQVRTRIGGTSYKRTATVPVAHGTEIIVECNYEGSLSMNQGAESSSYSITVQEENKAPAIKDSVSKTAAAKIDLGGRYRLDLSQIFNDEDGDTLNYTVAINGEKAVAAPQEYSFTPDKEGKYTLIFKANDGRDDGESVYTVTLNVVSSSEAKQNIDTAYEQTGTYMKDLGIIPGVGSTGGEWMTIGLARADNLPELTADGYYLNVVNSVKSTINASEQLHRVKSTENSRVILGLTAIGRDVTNVDGHNLLQGLTSMTYVKKQGINGPIWALIAFDSKNYDIPMTNENTDDQVTREKLIEYTLGKQLADGGWALSGTKADPDMTAMAIQSLAPYYSSTVTVKASVDRAIATLSDIQQENGGYASWGTVNPESIAQVIVALTSLDIDPLKDDRFIKNGYTLMDAMLQFYVDGGGFKHTQTTALNGMSTEQSYYALAAYDRLAKGKTSLYDMTDVITVGDKQAAKKVEDAIEDLGFISLSSEKYVADARTAYDALSESGKTLVNNYSKLAAAETKLKELKAEAEEANNKDNKGNASSVSGMTASAITKTIGAGKVPLATSTAASKAAISKITKIIGSANGDTKLPEKADDYTDEQMYSIIDAYKAYNELSAAEKLSVEKSDSYKKFEEILDKVGKLNHYDPSTGTDLSDNDGKTLPWYAKATVKSQSLSDQQKEDLGKTLGEESQVFMMEDISFTNVLDGSRWHPEDIVKVKLPMADIGKYKSAVIVHITDEGQIELIEGKVTGEFIEFEASSFSLYGIAGTMESMDDLLGAEDTASVLPWIVVIAIAFIAIVAILLIRKRNRA